MLRLKRKMIIYVKRDLASIEPAAYVMITLLLVVGAYIIPKLG